MKRKQDYERRERLSELLKEILADTLSQLDEPDLELLSITEVEVDNNLNRAKIFVTSLELTPKNESDILQALEKNLNVFRQDLGSKARIRQLPELSFHIDEGIKASTKIEEILRGLDES